MKFSDVQEIISAYENAMWSPSRMEVRYGCDCGCGGDSYTPESWDAAEQEAADAITKAEEFCKLYNIEYDGVE